MKKRYTGEPFPETVFATMETDGIPEEKPYPSFDYSPLVEIAPPDGGQWIAKYRLVSVRKLRKVTRVSVRDVR